MANQEHVDRLLRGVEAWNQWREKNPEIHPDLSEIDFDEIDLSDINFWEMHLSGVILSEVNLSDLDLHHADLRNADFREACLNQVNLSYADLSGANLTGASLLGAKLIRADLTGANLSRTVFSRLGMFSKDLVEVAFTPKNIEDLESNKANLSEACLEEADLSEAELSGINLNRCNFSRASLEGANLSEVQASGTDFTESKFTGACIHDWKISSDTKLDGVICEYIFSKSRPQYDESFEEERGEIFYDRRPHDPNQTFAPGEFTKRYQIVLETVELFFNDGIDWKAFLASLNHLQTEYGNEVNIQGIEKKAGGTFLVRLEVPSETDKGAIEQQVKASYEANLKQLEAQYHAELQTLKIQQQHSDEIITLYRQHNAEMKEITKLLASKPITVEAKAVAENRSSSESYTNHLNHSTIGNFANKMQDQASMQTNQYIGANLNEITSLIQSLRSSADAFPQEKRAETLEYLDDLEKDVQQPPEKRKVSRMRAALLALVTIATAVSGAVANTNEFVGQVQELSDKLDIELPIEQVQPQQPKAIEPEQP